jgi:dihydrolipoamide dehydrogenase
VTVLEFLPTILAGCDQDVVNVVLRSFRKRGIEVVTGVEVHGHSLKRDGSGTVLRYGSGDEVEVEMVVVSVGRRPRTEGLLPAGPRRLRGGDRGGPGDPG